MHVADRSLRVVGRWMFKVQGSRFKVQGSTSTPVCGKPAPHAYTLIEMIAVMAVIAILAAVMAPTIIRRVDRAAWTKETAELNAIADAFTQSILRTKTIPSETTWAAAVASQMSLPVSAITT